LFLVWTDFLPNLGGSFPPLNLFLLRSLLLFFSESAFLHGFFFSLAKWGFSFSPTLLLLFSWSLREVFLDCARRFHHSNSHTPPEGFPPSRTLCSTSTGFLLFSFFGSFFKHRFQYAPPFNKVVSRGSFFVLSPFLFFFSYGSRAYCNNLCLSPSPANSSSVKPSPSFRPPPSLCLCFAFAAVTFPPFFFLLASSLDDLAWFLFLTLLFSCLIFSLTVYLAPTWIVDPPPLSFFFLLGSFFTS